MSPETTQERPVRERPSAPDRPKQAQEGAAPLPPIQAYPWLTSPLSALMPGDGQGKWTAAWADFAQAHWATLQAGLALLQQQQRLLNATGEAMVCSLRGDSNGHRCRAEAEALEQVIEGYGEALRRQNESLAASLQATLGGSASDNGKLPSRG